MELLPVVNRQNRIIKTLPRSAVHRQKLWHRAVLIVVTDRKRRVYVQKRSSKKDAFPGYYEASVSGHVVKGETPALSAVRELREELHITTNRKRLKKIGTFRLYAQNEREFVTAFLLRDYTGKIHRHSEVSWGKFMERNISKLRHFHPGSLRGLSLVKKFLDD